MRSPQPAGRVPSPVNQQSPFAVRKARSVPELRWNRARSVSKQRRPECTKGRYPSSWTVDDSQPRSGDLSVVGPWIEDDPQPRSVDLFVGLNGSMVKIIKFKVARTAKWLGLSLPTPVLRHPCGANSHNPNQINKIGFCFFVVVS
jgi:hypothetical protein